MFVKIGKMPGRIEDLAVEAGTTIGEAVECVGLEVEGYQIRRNGTEADLDTTLLDGDIVLLTKKIKGNSDTIIKVGKMPGRIVDLAVESGTTVGDALECAELDTEGYQVRKNGTEVSEDEVVRNGDIILLTKKIKGNR